MKFNMSKLMLVVLFASLLGGNIVKADVTEREVVARGLAAGALVVFVGKVSGHFDGALLALLVSCAGMIGVKTEIHEKYSLFAASTILGYAINEGLVKGAKHLLTK